MAEIFFSPEARKDLLEIGDYIALQLRNKPAAQGLLVRIRKAVMALRQFPESGTPVDSPGLSVVYRYLVCGNYLIFYHLVENAVRIDRILYGRRDYLSILFGSELEENEKL